jgi:Zn-dependent peptidase ImmA (M78 family)
MTLRTKTPNPMSDIYERLQVLGLPKTWVRSHLLPDWWQDEMASVPSSRAQIEFLLARHLRLEPSALRSRSQPLQFKLSSRKTRFKHHENISDKQLRFAQVLGERVAVIAAQACETPLNLPQTTATIIRQQILATGVPWVSLERILDWCWNAGIPVVHLSHAPQGFRRFDGMAMWPEDRPVIICACNRKPEAWHLFHVAHELGHLALRHVQTCGELVDVKISRDAQGDADEQAANDFAIELLTGGELFTCASWPTGEVLAHEARSLGAQKQIEPGFLALSVSHNAKCYHVGSRALSILAPDVFRSFYSRLNWDEVGGDNLSLFEKLTDWQAT